MFENMDTDRSGTITFEELKTGLSKLGSKLAEAEIQQLMEAVRILLVSYLLLLVYIYTFQFMYSSWCSFINDTIRVKPL